MCKIKNWVDAVMKIPSDKYEELDVKMDNDVEECTKFMNSAISTLDTFVYGMNFRDDQKVDFKFIFSRRSCCN